MMTPETSSRWIVSAARRWKPGAVALATAVVTFGSGACSDPDTGSVSDDDTPSDSITSASEGLFVQEISEDACPAPDIIPSAYAAPSSDFTYLDQSTLRAYGESPVLSCIYKLDHEEGVPDGLQVVDGISVDFLLLDSPQELGAQIGQEIPASDAAAYLADWDEAGYSTKLDVGRPYGMGESHYFEMDLVARTANLEIQASIGMAVLDENVDNEPDIDAESAAFESFEAVIDHVLAQLERG